MKPYLKLIFTLVVYPFFFFSASAQTVSASFVGLEEVEIPAHNGGASTYFFLNLPLLSPAIHNGIVDSVDNFHLNLASANLVADALVENDSDELPLYYVEFLSGEATGLTVEIVANDTSSITLLEDLSSILRGGEKFIVRKFKTIGDVFSLDNSTYSLASAGNANQSDVIYLEDGTGNLVRYYYQTAPSFAGGNGWRRAGDTRTDRSNTRINWNAVLLSRNGSTARQAINFISHGEVRLGSAKTVISDGLNLVGYQFPFNTTLDNLGFLTSDLLQGSNPNNTDVIYIIESGELARFYYQSAPPFAGGNGWRRAGDTRTDQSDFIISSNAAFLVLKRGGNPIYMSSDQPF